MFSALIALVISTCFSCNDNIPEPDVQINRAVLVYMIADNNLYNNALADINEMESVWSDSYDGAVYVYMSSPALGEQKVPSKLYKVRQGTTSKIESEVVTIYPFSDDPAAPATLTKVIEDVRSRANAKSYGLMLWSHGSGWVPKGLAPLKSAEPPVNYSFGSSDTFRSEMEIDALAVALPTDIVFDFIEFDACYMASVEVSYQLRKNTKYVISSVAETLVAGMPYDRIMPDLMADQANVVGIAQKFYEYFNVQSGVMQSATISVVDCSKLTALATSLDNLISANPRNSSQIEYHAIQQYGRAQFVSVFYDLGDFVDRVWSGAPQLAAFNTALNDAVIYKSNTPWLFREIQVRTHSGLSAFIPRTGQTQAFTAFTTRFDWGKESGLSKISF